MAPSKDNPGEDKQLKELERLIDRAVDRITALASENSDLRAQLESAEKSGKSSEQEWAEQRKQVEEKLTDLVQRLAKVLDDAE